jgi:hypothetical protein
MLLKAKNWKEIGRETVENTILKFKKENKFGKTPSPHSQVILEKVGPTLFCARTSKFGFLQLAREVRSPKDRG